MRLSRKRPSKKMRLATADHTLQTPMAHTKTLLDFSDGVLSRPALLVHRGHKSYYSRVPSEQSQQVGTPIEGETPFDLSYLKLPKNSRGAGFQSAEYALMRIFFSGTNVAVSGCRRRFRLPGNRLRRHSRRVFEFHDFTGIDREVAEGPYARMGYARLDGYAR
jgi:hypothetical protein